MAGRVVFLGGLIAIFGAAALAAPPVAGTGAPVRACSFVPGRSVPASMPPGIDDPDPSPSPRPLPPPTGPIDAVTAASQLRVLDAIAGHVREEYLYPEQTRLVWETMLAIARSRIAAGLDDHAFETLLDWVVDRLGDDHSFVDSPADVAEEDASAAGRSDFVGIGVRSFTPAGSGREAVIAVFPDSPAAGAGLRPHDAMLAVDGKPFLDEAGQSRTRGPEGTSLTLTVQRPGEGVRDVTIVRRRVTGRVPVDWCLVPGTRIGYIVLPTLTDETVDDQARDALRMLTADGPLDGLVLDDRANLGGYGTVLDALLESFTGGRLGSWVDRHRSRRLVLRAVDIGGSQTVPLIVLVGPDTESYAEILAGVLQRQGRATLVGAPTHGNVEQLNRFELPEGWRLWLATTAFRPMGMELGSWERTGIVPDVSLPTRWDLFTEATDPALAVAIDLLDGG